MPAFTGREKRTSPVAGLTSVVTEMAKVMVQNCSKQSVETTNTSSSTSCAISPAKLATLRSNYLQQMRDVHALFESGAINEAEFLEQKVPILEQLKTLKPV